MATTTSKSVLLWTLLGPVTIAGSLGTPVQTIAIKRFTTESNRCAACHIILQVAPLLPLHGHHSQEALTLLVALLGLHSAPPVTMR